ncbi:MAG TPA: ATP-binding protein [Saprospiraceae bacterium]|nr:ATP-binding protein [Saprospiraceae bacterium]
MEESKVIGRFEEVKILNNLLKTNESELVAVIGRRRVGKTFLVKKTYEKQMIFKLTGIQDASKKEQLENFSIALSEAYQSNVELKQPKSWLTAFNMLKTFINNKTTKTKKVIFLDELPWLASSRSGFLQAFDHFWNSWAVDQNIIVVISGSAATWMITNVLEHKGGLHNRVTKTIKLYPFTLSEVEEYFKSKNINLPRYDILSIYMAIGGIPYYIKEVVRADSAVSAINRICFGKNAHLFGEFDKLYKSLFTNYQDHIAVIRALAKKHKGLTRNEILKETKLSTGGAFTLVLRELEESSFIESYRPYGKKERDTLYRIYDEFSLFFIDFIERNKNNDEFWIKNSNVTSVKTWSGYSFESVCIKHIKPIIKALGISGISTEQFSFYKPKSEHGEGFQIDMLIDRLDNAINICEMKYYNTEIILNADTSKMIRLRKANFIAATKTKKQVMTTLITTYGLVQNLHSSVIDQCITMDVLFD